MYVDGCAAGGRSAGIGGLLLVVFSPSMPRGDVNTLTPNKATTQQLRQNLYSLAGSNEGSR